MEDQVEMVEPVEIENIKVEQVKEMTTIMEQKSSGGYGRAETRKAFFHI